MQGRGRRAFSTVELEPVRTSNLLEQPAAGSICSLSHRDRHVGHASFLVSSEGRPPGRDGPSRRPIDVKPAMSPVQEQKTVLIQPNRDPHL